MIISLHNNESQWKHAKPILSLIDHEVIVATHDKQVHEGLVLEVTQGSEIVIESWKEKNNISIPLRNIDVIHYI